MELKDLQREQTFAGIIYERAAMIFDLNQKVEILTRKVKELEEKLKEEGGEK